MVRRERADEKVAVIIAILESDREILVVTCLLRRCFKVLWQQLLLFIKVVASPDIDQGWKVALVVLDQFRCVVLFAFRLPLIFAKVTLECLLAPWCLEWVGDGCECGD